MPGQHDGLLGQAEQLRARRLGLPVPVAAGRIRAPGRAGGQRVPCRGNPPARSATKPKPAQPAACPGTWSIATRRQATVTQPPGGSATSRGSGGQRDGRSWRPGPHRHTVRVRDRCGRGRVVEVPVGHQHPGGAPFVLGRRRLATVGDILTGVDHDAVAARSSDERVAVGSRRAGRKPDDEHTTSSRGPLGSPSLAAPVRGSHTPCP